MITAPKRLEIEEIAGMRCTFVVLYRKGGKPYCDGMFSATAAEAEADFRGMARELGWKVSDVEVRVRDPENLN